MIEKIKTVLRHNQCLALALVIALCLGVWLTGCESKVQSPFDPERTVTREQLNISVDTYLADIELAYKDLDKQDLFKQELFNIGTVIVKGGTVDPLGAGVTLLGILGIGAMADNRKKDSVIKTMQNERTT